jgi:endonuclease YncB( thermonuclease family)
VSRRLIACIAISAALAFFHSEIWRIASDSAPMQWAIGKLADIGEDSKSDKRDAGLIARFPVSKITRNNNPSTDRIAATHFPVCGSGKRRTCVVDGDTFWFNGEKIRLAGIDAPEIQGKCSSEKRLAARATQRLSQILSRQPFSMERSGVDRFGRTLADMEEVGNILVREGLARRWTGHKEVWCS